MTPNVPQPIIEKHVPERTCAACRCKRPQGEFVRLFQGEEGWTFTGGVRTGRGVYVCADSPQCWAEKRLRRAFGPSAPQVSERLQARPEAQLSSNQAPNQQSSNKQSSNQHAPRNGMSNSS